MDYVFFKPIGATFPRCVKTKTKVKNSVLFLFGKNVTCIRFQGIGATLARNRYTCKGNPDILGLPNLSHKDLVVLYFVSFKRNLKFK